MQSAAVLPLLAFGAVAQEAGTAERKRVEETTTLQKKMLEMNMVGAIKGPLVKGLPYSADEITETNQVLADGTRIHRETKVSVSRDAEGRTRRETPENVTIIVPVAGTTYVINTKTNAVRKLQMANTMIYRDTVHAGAGPGEKTTFSVHTSGDGQANIVINGQPLDPKAVAELIAKAKAEGRAEVKGDLGVVVSDGNFGFVHASGAAPVTGTFTTGPMVIRRSAPGKEESLGKKNMEGVIAEGKRNVETIEAGAIGNDRPIQIVNEHWYSDELGQMVYSKRSDPRTGEEIFRVTNIRRGDPPAYLFQAPPDTHVERKM
jgi:hypothetical protein